jgi:hypothetical protein
MDIEELIYVIYLLVNEYIDDKITIDENPWLETETLKILNNNIGIDFYNFIYFLTKCLDKIVHKRIRQDAKIETKLNYKNRFQTRLFSKKINNRIINKVKIN